MYAIVVDSGRQIKVEEGQVLDIDFRDLQTGDVVKFDRVLACGEGAGLKIGKPTVDGASVSAEVVGVVMGEKLTVQKFRRRKNSRRKTGHRQLFTRIKIAKIEA